MENYPTEEELEEMYEDYVISLAESGYTDYPLYLENAKAKASIFKITD